MGKLQGLKTKKRSILRCKEWNTLNIKSLLCIFLPTRKGKQYKHISTWCYWPWRPGLSSVVGRTVVSIVLGAVSLLYPRVILNLQPLFTVPGQREHFSACVRSCHCLTCFQNENSTSGMGRSWALSLKAALRLRAPGECRC